MSKSNKVYNKQYKDIKEVEAKITRTDNNHTNLKDANFMLDVRIPTKKRKITLTDLYDLVVDIKEDVKDLKVRVTNIENDINNIVKLNNLKR
jgi:seryl-tRNA synthetase